MEFMKMLANFALFAVSWVLVYLGIPGEPIAILAILMLLDMMSGIGRAYVLKNPITSSKISAGFASKGLFLAIPISVALAAKAIGTDFYWFVAVVIHAMILSELYSFISNVYAIKTGEKLPEFDVIKIIGNRIKQMVEALLSQTK